MLVSRIKLHVATLESFQRGNLHEREKAIKCVSFFIIRHRYSNTDAYRFDSDCNVKRAINVLYYYVYTRRLRNQAEDLSLTINIMINNSGFVIDAVYGGSTLRSVLRTLESTLQIIPPFFRRERERGRGAISARNHGKFRWFCVKVLPLNVPRLIKLSLHSARCWSGNCISDAQGQSRRRFSIS